MRRFIVLIIYSCYLFVSSVYSQDTYDIENTFKDKKFEKAITKEEMILIRYYNNNAQRVGSWYTITSFSPSDAVKMLALPPKSLACSLEVVRVHKNITYYKGIAASGYWILNNEQKYVFVNSVDYETYKVSKNPTDKQICFRQGGGKQIYIDKKNISAKDILHEVLNTGNIAINFEMGDIVYVKDTKQANYLMEQFAPMSIEKILKKVNEYLPAELRASDIDKAGENFVNYIVEKKKGIVTEKEVKVIMDEENVYNGLYDYWLKNISNDKNKCFILLCAILISNNKMKRSFESEKIIEGFDILGLMGNISMSKNGDWLDEILKEDKYRELQEIMENNKIELENKIEFLKK